MLLQAVQQHIVEARCVETHDEALGLAIGRANSPAFMVMVLLSMFTMPTDGAYPLVRVGVKLV